MSDQDFFFDEDEETAAKPQPKKAGPAASKSAGKAVAAPVVSATPVGSGTLVTASVPMTVAVLIGVIGILVGAIIGIFVGRSLTPAPTSAIPSATTPAATTGSAPQLSPDQLNSSELPAGHPSIGKQSSAATTGK